MLPGKQNTVGAGHARDFARSSHDIGRACKANLYCEIAIAGAARSYNTGVTAIKKELFKLLFRY